MLELKQDDKGKFNFDQTAVRNPETGELVSYLPCPVHYWIPLCFTLFMNCELPITVMKWAFRLSDLELVQGQRDMGQQVLHHRLFLWGVSSWVCRSLPVSQQTGSQVSHWTFSHFSMDSLRWNRWDLNAEQFVCPAVFSGMRGRMQRRWCMWTGWPWCVLACWDWSSTHQRARAGDRWDLDVCLSRKNYSFDWLSFRLNVILASRCRRHTCRPGLWFCGFCWRLEKDWLVWRSAQGQMDDQMLS